MGLPPTLFQVQQQISQTRKCLYCTRQYLIRWQHKAIIARVPQLRGEGVLRPADVRHVVDTAARYLIDGRTDRS